MNINGIIAEYNPFHNGHQYQLEESRRLTGAKFTVVAMSGNFVQRGAPALVDKRLRTEMALCCGADLVLELPVLYATASSEYFAAGAVALLSRLGVVTHLCFGSECGDTAALGQVGAFLAKEPEAYRAALKRLLKQGLSYPDARAKALSMQGGLPDANFPPMHPAPGGSAGKRLPGQAGFPGNRSNPDPCPLPLPGNCLEILSSPNNILGIDYIKEIIKRGSSITPVTVKRTGSGYHDMFPSPTPSGSSMHAPAASCAASALAIRRSLEEGRHPAQLHPYMPKETWPLLEAYLAGTRALYPDDISGLLYYKLLLGKEPGYGGYLDVSPELSNRIRNGLDGFTGFRSFCDALKTKAVTHTRISRCLTHILLGVTKELMDSGIAQDYTPYARVLGFRRSAEPLLKAVKSHSAIPLITKLAGAQKSLPPEAGRLLQLDILASEIYKGVASAGTGRPAPNEFSTPLVIL